MSLSQCDKDGTRLVIAGPDGLLCIWQYICPRQRINIVIEGELFFLNNSNNYNKNYSLQPPHICQ